MSASDYRLLLDRHVPSSVRLAASLQIQENIRSTMLGLLEDRRILVSVKYAHAEKCFIVRCSARAEDYKIQKQSAGRWKCTGELIELGEPLRLSPEEASFTDVGVFTQLEQHALTINNIHQLIAS